MTAHDLLVRWQATAARAAELSDAIEGLRREHAQRSADEAALRQELARLIRVQPSRSIGDAEGVWTTSGPVSDPRLVRRPEPRAAHAIDVARAAPDGEDAGEGLDEGVQPGRPRVFAVSPAAHDDAPLEADVAEAQAWARNCAPRRRGA